MRPQDQPANQSNGQLSTAANGAQAKANEATADAGPSMTVSAYRIDYVKPEIRLMGFEFIEAGDSRTQKNLWTPDRAYIAHGMLVIEEYGISLPTSYVKAIRVAKKGN